ncbi:MAG TPA: hypothetical protein VH415_09660 [Nitrososphaeraceae archaeon]
MSRDNKPKADSIVECNLKADLTKTSNGNEEYRKDMSTCKKPIELLDKSAKCKRYNKRLEKEELTIEHIKPRCEAEAIVL